MSQANADPAIKRIHVFSTGSGDQHKEHRYGSRLPVLWWVLTSQSWINIPINAFVLEHRDGLVLFDTGMNPAIESDPNYISSAVGRFLLHRIFRLHIAPEDALNKLLPTPGHTPGSMSMLVRSQGLPPLLLVGDLTYELDLLLNDQVPGIGDAAALRSSFAKVRALKEQLPDLVLLPAHDLKTKDALMQLQ